MLPVYLEDDAMLVFWLSIVCMAITLTARVAECVRYYTSNMVKPDKCICINDAFDPPGWEQDIGHDCSMVRTRWVRRPTRVPTASSDFEMPSSRP